MTNQSNDRPASSKPSRVLAFGAAGSAAGEVIPALAARDVPVRGFVRHEEQRQAVLGRGADQVVLGDLGDRDSIQAALDGVDAAFYLPRRSCPTRPRWARLWSRRPPLPACAAS
jgi:uncharacterized protein YbjT (DUF2867 family)